MKARDLIEGLQIIIDNFGDVDVMLPPGFNEGETEVIGMMLIKKNKRIILCNTAVAEAATGVPGIETREYHS